MRTPTSCVWLVLAVAALSAVLPAQMLLEAQRDRAVSLADGSFADRPGFFTGGRGATPAVDPPATYDTRLELKFVEGSAVALQAGSLVSNTGADIESVARWLGGFRVTPMVTSVPLEQLDAWHAHALAVLPEGNRPGHLGLWFYVDGDDAASVENLRQSLAREPLVAHVYQQPRLYLASATPAAIPVAPRVAASSQGDLPPTTPSYTSQQFTHDPTPLGHGVRAAAGTLGARGQGIGLRMLETDWLFGHEDLCQLVAANVLGAAPPGARPAGDHGASGSSIVFADRNAYGVTGIADEVSARFVALELNGGYVNSMTLVLANSQPGDVALIVVMVLVPALGPGAWLPFEFFQSSFDATLTATANGMHVVVPAGNGDRSLDDPALLGRFDRNFRDSGAIIVGASAAGLMQKADFSNWGTRIDAHGWGDQVIACGYGSLFYPNNDPLQAYTAAGTGTSSATPHIAAIVASLQGAALRQTGQLLSNQAVLDLLHTQGAPTPDVIGLRPDLAGMLTQIGAIDGLRMTAPDAPIGGLIEATMDGQPGSVAALFGSFATSNLPLGFNRNVHLDLLQMASLGAFVLGASGTAQYQLPVPNNVTLQGADIYFQAVRLTGTQPLFVTNSCQATIL